MSGYSATSRKTAASGKTATSRASLTAESLAAIAESAEGDAPPMMLQQAASVRSGRSGPSQVPLLLDTRQPEYTANSPFRSGVGTGLALPGKKLSSVA